MRNDKRWCVRLGDRYWVAYTYPRPEGSALRLIGSIARGAQVGALAETDQGRCVQVNGDHVTPLSNSQARRAVAAARAVAELSRPAQRHDDSRTTVVVTVKRRRLPVDVPL